MQLNHHNIGRVICTFVDETRVRRDGVLEDIDASRTQVGRHLRFHRSGDAGLPRAWW